LEDKKQVVVLGAGVGGLAAGYFLSRTGKFAVKVLEEAPVVGGLCASFKHDGFVLDYGAHKLYSVIPGVLDEIKDVMSDRLLTLPKINRLYLRGHLVDYPLRFGNLARAIGPASFVKLAAGYAAAFSENLFNHHPAGSYEEYIVKHFGRPAYEMVFEPLAEKVWGNPAQLHSEMARTRVPASGGFEVILKLIGLKKETSETNAEFFYYPRGGFGDWPQALREGIEDRGGEVIVNARIEKLEMKEQRITAVAGTVCGQPVSFQCDYLISSIPLPVLGRMVFHHGDEEFNRAVEGLQFRHLILVYIFAERSLALDAQWIFFPERQFIFSRIFEQKQMNPDLGPHDQTAICCDFTGADDSWQWQATDQELADKCVEGLVSAGFIKSDEVTGYVVKRRRNFYPRYDLQYVEKMQIVSSKLQRVQNLLLTGRIGMYNYNNSDHCADMGRFIAENLAAGKAPKEIWDALEERVKDYKIVD